MNKKTILSIENISKIYRNNDIHVPALIDVSLTIEEGEFVMITGRNGSGKSTLLHQLGLLDMPDKGKIMLNNKEVVSMDEGMRTKLRLEYLGYIFQEYALIAGAIFNIDIFMDVHLKYPKQK